MLIKLQLQHFDTHVNVTTDNGTQAPYNDLSPGMKEYYSPMLIENAQPKLVHSKFLDKAPIPQHEGDAVKFRKYAALPKVTDTLVEGVTPDGGTLDMSDITVAVDQYGYYVVVSDKLSMTHIDDVLVRATELLGAQAGLTIDTIDRNALQAGTNVTFASKWSGDTETVVVSRSELDKTAILKVDTLEQVTAKLKTWNAQPFEDGYYRAVVHPYVVYDLRRDPDWLEARKYAQPEEIMSGEVGRIAGIRFFETSEAKIYAGKKLTAASRTLTVKTAVTNNTSVPVKELITADDVTAFAAREANEKKVYIAGTEYTVSALVAGAAGSASLTLSAAASIAQNAVIAPKGGAGDGSAVFGTLVYGKNAAAVTEIEGGGLEFIAKPRGSSGVNDALNQRASAGWKLSRATKILTDDYIVRVESCSTRFSAIAEEN